MTTTSEVRIRTQKTPNPNAWKYILDRDVKREGKISYTEIPACEHVPLAAELLRLANVTQVHFFENVITVTQNGASDWSVLDQAVQDRLQNLVPEHDAGFVDTLGVSKPVRNFAAMPPELQTIDDILEYTIRPGLQADGGDIEVVELDGNILTIRYQGACGGCPSSTAGTLHAIESILRDQYNPNLEVVAL